VIEVAFAAFLASSMTLMAAHAYPDGAPPGFSGGFREDSCHACHFNQDLNAPSGRLSVDGLPAQYEAGKRYTLTITLSRSGMKSAGFQLTARFKDGAQAGTLVPSAADAERIAIARDGSVQYAGQNKAGSLLAGGDAARWTVDWTAPPDGGNVIFNVAANAADGNGSSDGDFIYTFSAETTSMATPGARGSPGT
jgi:hypothetical protein